MRIDRLIDETWNAVQIDPLAPRIVLVEMPPRHGKSEFTSKYVPARFLCKHPDKRVILSSYAASLSTKFGMQARDLVEQEGQSLGVYVNPRRRAAGDWEIAGHGGGMVSAGLRGALTGKGFHLGIIDDAVKNAEEALSPTISEKNWDWYQSVFLTRAEPGAIIIVMGTRWGDDDLQGRVIKQAEDDGEPIKVLRLSALAEENDPLGREPGEALWEERIPRRVLERQKRITERYWWNALYQQTPDANRNAEWPREYFGPHAIYDKDPDPGEIVAKVMALDASLAKSSTADYQAYVFLTLTKGGVVYVDADIDRNPIPKLIANGADHIRWFHPDEFLVEVNNFGGLEDLIYTQWDGILPPLATVTQHENKEARIKLTIGPLLHNRRLRFKRGSIGADRLLEQLQQFPCHAHDDGPDALEMGLQGLRKYRAGTWEGIDDFYRKDA